MKSGATESSFYYLNQYYNIPKDVEISRSIEILAQSNKKYKILWAHDNCDQPQLLRLPELVSQIDKIVCVSNWEKEQYIKYNRAPEEKIVVIPNGVADIFTPKQTKSKTAIYFSAPHKGLAPLSKIWKQVIKNHPDATLKVFSSHNLYGEKYEDHFKIQEHFDAIEELKSLPNVLYSPCIDREELLSHIQDAAFFVHPNVWEETFCVSMAEAMSCGCYPIVSDIGALREVSFNRGKYIPMTGTQSPEGWKVSLKFINQFAQELSKAFEFFDKEPQTFYRATQDLSTLTRETYDWKKISNSWKLLIEGLQNQTRTYYCMVNTSSSKEYTKEAIKSFFETTKLNSTDKFFLIDNDGSYEYSSNLNYIKNDTPKSFAENMNFILKLALMDKADFVGLNNDLIFTENWNESIKVPNTISVSLSNQHIGEDFIKPIMNLSDYLENKDKLNAISKKIISQSHSVNTNLIPFYCFHLPYEVSSKVGLFDENFENGAEDIDYRLRASQLGFDAIVNDKSYVIHFVGKSTWLGGETQKETEKRNLKYYNHFENKWGKELADKLLHK